MRSWVRQAAQDARLQAQIAAAAAATPSSPPPPPPAVAASSAAATIAATTAETTAAAPQPPPAAASSMAATAAAAVTAPTPSPSGSSPALYNGGHSTGGIDVSKHETPHAVYAKGRQLLYSCHMASISPSIRGAFKQLGCDAGTQAFLDACNPSYMASYAAYALNAFMSVTDTNAILNRGQMHVLSKGQCVQLLGDHVRGSLLDVGAGDGNVTAKLATLHKKVVATEISKHMTTRLAQKGFIAVNTAELGDEVAKHGPFDTVSLLNVLDRCDRPQAMVQSMMDLLSPTGRILMAIVLPFCEFVEDGTKQRAPVAPLPLKGARCRDNASFERSLSALVDNVFIPMGLEVESWSRIPYLCSGDHVHDLYVLDDAVLVMKRRASAKEGASGGAGGAGGGAGAGASIGVGADATGATGAGVGSSVADSSNNTSAASVDAGAAGVGSGAADSDDGSNNTSAGTVAAPGSATVGMVVQAVLASVANEQEDS